MCVQTADAEAETAEPQEAAAEAAEPSGDDSVGKNESILQIKLRKVVVMIGKAGNNVGLYETIRISSSSSSSSFTPKRATML